MNNGQFTDKRTRILYVITKSVWGGAQKYVYDLATGLPRERFFVAVALGGDGPLATALLKADITIYPVAHFQKSINPLKDILAFFEFLRILTRFRPDVIHLNSSKAGGVGAAAVRLYNAILRHNVYTLFTVHGWAFLEPRSAMSRLFRRIASRATSILANRIICISRHDEKAAHVYHMAPARKITFIPNGVHTLHVLPRDEAQRQLLGNTYPLLIGTIAEWTKNKGLTFFIDAIPSILKEYPKAVFCLVGWGEDEQLLRKTITERNLTDAIFLVQASPAAPLLAAFDIFVLPSLKEGLPYTLLEAAQAHVPIVATTVGGVPDLIMHEQHGLLVPPASSEELAEAILHLLRDHTLAQRLAQHAQEMIHERFSFARMLERTMRIYEERLR